MPSSFFKEKCTYFFCFPFPVLNMSFTPPFIWTAVLQSGLSVANLNTLTDPSFITHWTWFACFKCVHRAKMHFSFLLVFSEHFSNAAPRPYSGMAAWRDAWNQQPWSQMAMGVVWQDFQFSNARSVFEKNCGFALETKFGVRTTYSTQLKGRN